MTIIPINYVKTVEGDSMKLTQIKNKLNEHQLNGESTYRYYSVFIPFVNINDEPHLLYEVRSENLRSQPGEVCFPGGRIETDENPDATAIRETCEELGVDPSQIEIFDEIESIITPFNVVIYLFAGELKIDDIQALNINEDEVQRVFTVPFKFFLENEPDAYYVDSEFKFPEDFPFHKIIKGRSYNWRTGQYPIYFYDYEDEVIWGMTARMTKNIVRTLTKNDAVTKEEQLETSS